MGARKGHKTRYPELASALLRRQPVQVAFLGGDAEGGVRCAVAAITIHPLQDLEEQAAIVGQRVDLEEGAVVVLVIDDVELLHPVDQA